MMEEREIAKTEAQRASDKGVGPSPAPSSRKAIVIALILLVLGSALILILPRFLNSSAGDKDKAKAAKKERVVPVTVATAGMQIVPIEVRTIGNVLAYSQVNVTSQVGGQLTKVYFTQGQFVKKGEPLFQIDPRQYQAAVAQAEGIVAKDRGAVESAEANLKRDKATIGQYEANLSRDRASLNFANIEKKRYALLLGQGVVSHEQADQYTTNAATAEATIQADLKNIENAQAVVMSDQAAIDTAKGTLKSDLAALDNARLQLSWTRILSPMDGRTSSLSVYEGNIVSANSNQSLVSIVQVDPIYVTVSVPEKYLNDMRRAQSEGTLKMQASLEGRRKDFVKGTISFMENTVNTANGTITLRASFENKEVKLFPGQFVDVVISMPPKGPSVTVPTRAIQTTQQGTSVYVVRPDQTVALVQVKAGQASGDLTAVQTGLAQGDIVVTDGQLQLAPGAKVKVQPDDDPARGAPASQSPARPTAE
jgi:multidrug efflux system membrane fusion protein